MDHRARPDGRRHDGSRAPEHGRQPDTLGDLDLVATPVSVTPPRTWRRAAWFSVAASCVVLAVLVFAAARLADRPFERLDAFPGLPTGGLLTAQPLGPPVHPSPTGTPGAGPGVATAPGGEPEGPAGEAPEGGPILPGGDGGQPPGGPGPLATGGGQPRDDPPPVPTVTVRPTTDETPPVTATELIDTTTTFFGKLPKRVDEAWEMVGPRVKIKGYGAFRKQWAGAKEVRLEELDVDPDNATVLATVRMVAANGDEDVQHFLMNIRKGNSLIIEEITPTTGG